MAAVNAVGRATGLEPLEPIADARAGDLYERHARRVYAYCRSRLSRNEDAEDAVQTTFLHAVNGLRRGVTPGHELAWLLGIARNVCLARLESAGRRGRLELVCDPVDLERSAAPVGRGDELIGLELALAKLPEQQRRAVLLRDWRGLSYEEVAAQLGVSLANAETLIFRGRRTLAELLQEEPSATRRRLASIGNVGSLFTWAKAAFTGATAAAKLAAAVAVLAISGAGVAVGTGALGREPKAAQPTPAAAVPAESASSARALPEHDAPRPYEAGDTVSQGSRAPSAPNRGLANPAQPTDGAVANAPAEPVEAGDTVSQGPVAGGAPPAPTTALPKASDAVPAAKAAVGSTVDDVSDTVEQIAPALAPVTEPVTDAVVGAVESLTVPEVPIATPPLIETVVAAVPPVAVAPLPVDPAAAAPTLLP